MADERLLNTPEERDIWRRYYQAALAGALAARVEGGSDKVAIYCANHADALVREERRRHPIE